MRYYKQLCGGGKPNIEIITGDIMRLPDWAKKMDDAYSRIRYSAYFYRAKYRHLLDAMHEVLGNNPQQFKVYDTIVKAAKRLEEEEDKLASPALKDCDERFRNLLAGKIFKTNEVTPNSKDGKEVSAMGCCGGKKGCKGGKKPTGKGGKKC